MKLTAQEELALRRLGNQARSIAPDVARPLVRLALAEPYRDAENPTTERKPLACHRQYP